MRKILSSQLYIPVLVVFMYFILSLATIAINLQAPTEEPTAAEKSILNPIVSIVEKELKNRGLVFNPARIYLTDMRNMSNAVGVTITDPQVYLGKWIELRQSYYINAPDEIKEALVLHEYGHYLGLEHNNGMGSMFCPMSVMHYSHDMEGCFFRYREYYYNELAQEVLSL